MRSVLAALPLLANLLLCAACGVPGSPGSPPARPSPSPVGATVTGVVVVAPCRPVERQGDPVCPPVPNIVLHFQPAGGGSAVSTRTDATGSYRIVLPPGDYLVRADGGIAARPATPISLLAGAAVVLNITVDSGIR